MAAGVLAGASTPDRSRDLKALVARLGQVGNIGQLRERLG